MKVAIPYENGKIFPHFGHTEQFKIYEVDGREVISSELISTNGSGHGALAGFLTKAGVGVLICGGIGGGAKAALAEAGIALFGGVTGEADTAIREYLQGTLLYDPDVLCRHHSHGNHHTHGCNEPCAGNNHCGH